MATKRSLYKPAPQENVGPHRARKTLAQGRLVSAPSLQPQFSGEVVTSARPVQASAVPTCVPSGRGQIDDFTVTPRKYPPQATHSSPEQNRTSQNLDLSDSEIDFPNYPKNRCKAGREGAIDVTQPEGVMVLETVPLSDIEGRSDVGIMYNFEKSPGRVIRHSPSAIKSGLKPAEDADADRWQVGVDRVPKVSFMDPDADVDETLVEAMPDEQQPLISPLIIREKKTEQVPPQKSASPKRTSKPKPPYPQPNFDDSQMTRLSKMESGAFADAMDDAQSNASESDACSLLEYVPSAAKAGTKPRTKGQSALSSTKKKRKERIVPSRYLEAASRAAKAQNSILEKSSASRSQDQVKKNLSLRFGKSSERPAVSKPRKASSAPQRDRAPSGGTRAFAEDPPTLVQRSRKASGGRRAPAEEASVSVCTPRDQAVHDMKSSTPTHDSVSVVPQEIDASAIRGECSLLSLVSDTSHLHSMIDRSMFLEAGEGEDVDQELLDVLYARYQQWVFLNASAKNTFKDQEKQAMAQCSWLWEEVEKLRRHETDLKLDLARLHHRNMLDDQLDLQQSGLAPVTVNLDKIGRQHSTLAAGLDTTRHQLETRDIYVPSDQDQYIVSLEAALVESEQLLGEISRMSRQHTPTISSFAQTLNDLQRAVDSECQELSRCNELLAATQSLAIHETSLKFQEVESASALARN